MAARKSERGWYSYPSLPSLKRALSGPPSHPENDTSRASAMSSFTVPLDGCLSTVNQSCVRPVGVGRAAVAMSKSIRFDDRTETSRGSNSPSNVPCRQRFRRSCAGPLQVPRRYVKSPTCSPRWVSHPCRATRLLYWVGDPAERRNACMELSLPRLLVTVATDRLVRISGIEAHSTRQTITGRESCVPSTVQALTSVLGRLGADRRESLPLYWCQSSAHSIEKKSYKSIG